MSKSGLRDGAVRRLVDAYCRGRWSRRDFLSRLLAAGVAYPLANGLAERWASAAYNQRARRADGRSAYDYIIVGAGSAGCVLAHRLTEDPSVRVLVVEAGGADLDAPGIQNPLLWFTNLDAPYAFPRLTTPQPGLGGRQILTSGGKVIGGSGSINASIWLKPDVRDFREWQHAAGPSWRPRTLERLFRRIERYMGQNASLGFRRGYDGPIPVETPSLAHPLTYDFLEAARVELGLRVIDLNSRLFHNGAGVLDYNVVAGDRVGPARAYLWPALERPNLTLLTDTQVERLYLEGDRCLGVKVLVDGEPRVLTAERDVIVCAGALGSPALLMRSGIGSADELKAHDIPARVHLPGVGRNLQDHVLVFGIAFSTKRPLPPARASASVAASLSVGKPFEAPGVRLFTSNSAFGIPGLPPEQGYGVGPALMKPKSRGQVKLTSSDPGAPLFIDPRYFEEEEDRQALLEGLRQARALGLSEALGHVRAAELSPGGDLGPDGNLAFIQQTGGTFFHYVGTCAMGRGKESVVDPALRVNGVSGLRVVDASVIPTIPSVPTHVATLIVAERASDLLRRGKRRGGPQEG